MINPLPHRNRTVPASGVAATMLCQAIMFQCDFGHILPVQALQLAEISSSFLEKLNDVAEFATAPWPGGSVIINKEANGAVLRGGQPRR